jgi:DNA repair exonuclease SbcCD ATPase subunit
VEVCVNIKKTLLVKFFVILILCNIDIFSHNFSNTFTIQDRERLIRLEEKLNSVNQRVDILEKSLNQRSDGFEKSLNQRIDDVKEEIRDLKTFMLWGFGILFSGMGILMGFVLWDRRTAISPVIKRTKELEEENEKIYKVLKEMGKRDTKIAQILKQVGIL